MYSNPKLQKSQSSSSNVALDAQVFNQNNDQSLTVQNVQPGNPFTNAQALSSPVQQITNATSNQGSNPLLFTPISLEGSHSNLDSSSQSRYMHAPNQFQHQGGDQNPISNVNSSSHASQNVQNLSSNFKNSNQVFQQQMHQRPNVNTQSGFSFNRAVNQRFLNAQVQQARNDVIMNSDSHQSEFSHTFTNQKKPQFFSGQTMSANQIVNKNGASKEQSQFCPQSPTANYQGQNSSSVQSNLNPGAAPFYPQSPNCSANLAQSLGNTASLNQNASASSKHEVQPQLDHSLQESSNLSISRNQQVQAQPVADSSSNHQQVQAQSIAVCTTHANNPQIVIPSTLNISSSDASIMEIQQQRQIQQQSVVPNPNQQDQEMRNEVPAIQNANVLVNQQSSIVQDERERNIQINNAIENIDTKCIVCQYTKHEIDESNKGKNIQWIACLKPRCQTLMCLPCYENFDKENQYELTKKCPGKCYTPKKEDHDIEYPTLLLRHNLFEMKLKANQLIQKNEKECARQLSQEDKKNQIAAAAAPSAFENNQRQNSEEEVKVNDERMEDANIHGSEHNVQNQVQENQEVNSNKSSRIFYSEKSKSNDPDALSKSSKLYSSEKLEEEKLEQELDIDYMNKDIEKFQRNLDLQKIQELNRQFTSQQEFANIQNFQQQREVINDVQPADSFSWKQYSQVHEKYRIERENILHRYAASKLKKYLNPANQGFSVLYTNAVLKFREIPDDYNNHFVGMVRKNERSLVKENWKWMDDQNKKQSELDQIFLNYDEEAQPLLFKPDDDYEKQRPRIPFRSVLNEFLKDCKKIIEDSIHETTQFLGQINQSIHNSQTQLNSRKRVMFQDDNQVDKARTKKEVKEQLIFYKWLKKFSERNEKVYHDPSSMIQRMSECKNQKVLENSLAKLHEIFIEAQRQLRLQSQNSPHYKPLESLDGYCQKIKQIWNQMNEFLSIPSFEQGLAQIGIQADENSSLLSEEVKERNIFNVQVDETLVQEQSSIDNFTDNTRQNNQNLRQMINGIIPTNIQAQSETRTSRSNEDKKIVHNLSPSKREIGNDQRNSRSSFKNQYRRSPRISEKEEKKNEEQLRKQDINKPSPQRYQKKDKQFMFQNKQQNLQKEVDDHMNMRSIKQKKLTDSLQRELFLKTVRDRQQKEIDQQNEIDESQKQIKPPKISQKQIIYQNQQYQRLSHNASQERTLKQKWLQNDISKVCKKRLEAMKNILPSYQNFQSITQRYAETQQNILNDFEQQQHEELIATNMINQAQISNQRELNDDFSDYHFQFLPLKEFDKYLEENDSIFDTNQEIRNTRQEKLQQNAMHQVLSKIDEIRNEEVVSSKIGKLSRKALKAACYNQSNKSQNMIFTYGYNDGRGRGLHQTFTQILQIYVQVPNKKSDRGNYGQFKQAFSSTEQVIKLLQRFPLQENMEAGSNLIIPLEILKLLNDLNLEGLCLGIKLVLPFDEDKQLSYIDAGEICYLNAKGRENIQKQFQSSSEVDLEDPQIDKNIYQLGVLYNLLQQLKLNEKIPVYAFGFNSRPFNFSAHSRDMRILTYTRACEAQSSVRWIKESELEKPEFNGLGLKTQDDFPVMHLLITTQNKWENSKEKVFKFTRLDYNQNNILDLSLKEELTVQQIRAKLQVILQEHNQIRANLDRGLRSLQDPPVIEQKPMNLYCDYVQAEQTHFESGLIKQDLTVAIKDETDLKKFPKHANFIKRFLNFSSNFVNRDVEEQKEIYLGKNRVDSKQVFDAEKIQSYMGFNLYKSNPQCVKREEQSLTRMQRQEGQQFSNQRGSSRGSSSQANPNRRRSRVNQRSSVLNNQSKEVASSLFDPDRPHTSLDAINDLNQLFYTNDDDDTKIKRIQYQQLLRMKEAAKQMKTIEDELYQTEQILQEIGQTELSASTESEDSSTNPNSSNQRTEQLQIADGLDLTVTQEDRNNLYVTKALKQFYPTSQHSVFNRDQQTEIENLAICTKLYLKQEFIYNQIRGFNGQYAKLFKQCFNQMQNLMNPDKPPFIMRHIKNKDTDMEILIHPKKTKENNNVCYDMMFNIPVRVRIETNNDVVSYSNRSANRSVHDNSISQSQIPNQSQIQISAQQNQQPVVQQIQQNSNSLTQQNLQRSISNQTHKYTASKQPKKQGETFPIPPTPASRYRKKSEPPSQQQNASAPTKIQKQKLLTQNLPDKKRVAKHNEKQETVQAEKSQSVPKKSKPKKSENQEENTAKATGKKIVKRNPSSEKKSKK